MTAVIIKPLGQVDYLPIFKAMQEFTAFRANRESADKIGDEIWLCEHPPVFTQGLSGKAEHVLRDIGIPVVPIDRGGQVTYHGPGQVVAYLLLDLRRRNLKVRELVNGIEQAVIDLLANYQIGAQRFSGAPGVYVGSAKIAALGLRIKNGCSYHGVALNVDMDLAPYGAINPCGYSGLVVTQMRDLCGECNTAAIGAELGQLLAASIER